MSIEITKELNKDGIKITVHVDGFVESSITITKDDLRMVLAGAYTVKLMGTVKTEEDFQSSKEYIKDMFKEVLLDNELSLVGFETYNRATVLMVAKELSVALNVEYNPQAITRIICKDDFTTDDFLNYFLNLVAKKSVKTDESKSSSKVKEKIKAYVENTMKEHKIELEDMDSLDVVEFAKELEEEYGIDLAEGDELRDAKSIDDIVDHVFDKLGKQIGEHIHDEDEDDEDEREDY